MLQIWCWFGWSLLVKKTPLVSYPGLVQVWSNSIANAMELLPSCPTPSICYSSLSGKWFPHTGSLLIYHLWAHDTNDFLAPNQICWNIFIAFFYCFYFIAGHIIANKFCTYHGNTPRVTYTKLCKYDFIDIWTKAKQILYASKKSLLKWAW